MIQKVVVFYNKCFAFFKGLIYFKREEKKSMNEALYLKIACDFLNVTEEYKNLNNCILEDKVMLRFKLLEVMDQYRAEVSIEVKLYGTLFVINKVKPFISLWLEGKYNSNWREQEQKERKDLVLKQEQQELVGCEEVKNS